MLQFKKPSSLSFKQSTKKCFVMLVSVILVSLFLLSSCGRSIAITNSIGNVSVKYVRTGPGVMQESLLIHYTEDELVENADLIFSGKISKIKHIEINFSGSKRYKSLITIDIDEVFKGSLEKTTVVMLTACCDNKMEHTSTGDLLYTLKKGDYGIFLTNFVPTDTFYVENGCKFDISEICDVKAADGMRFAVIKEGKDGIRTSFADYPSLKNKTWDSVIPFIKEKISSSASSFDNEAEDIANSEGSVKERETMSSHSEPPYAIRFEDFGELEAFMAIVTDEDFASFMSGNPLMLGKEQADIMIESLKKTALPISDAEKANACGFDACFSLYDKNEQWFDVTYEINGVRYRFSYYYDRIPTETVADETFTHTIGGKDMSFVKFSNANYTSFTASAYNDYAKVFVKVFTDDISNASFDDFELDF